MKFEITYDIGTFDINVSVSVKTEEELTEVVSALTKLAIAKCGVGSTKEEKISQELALAVPNA